MTYRLDITLTMDHVIEKACEMLNGEASRPLFCVMTPQQGEVLGVTNGQKFEFPGHALTITFTVNEYVPGDGPFLIPEFTLKEPANYSIDITLGEMP